ncbi:MAG: hypothetical protein AABW64_03490, partial [Nanoarchaeota archaeon]
VAIGSATLTSLVIDHTPPAVTVEILDKDTNTPKSKFFFGDEIKVRCTRSDPTAGFNDTNLSMFIPSSALANILSKTTKVGSASEAIDEIFKDTKTLGTYVAACNSQDRAGLVNATQNVTFEVVIKPPTKSTVPKGFENPVGKKVISGEADLGRLTAEKAISIQLKATSQVKMDIKGTTYIFTVKSFTENDLNLQAGTTTITAKKGESAESDLDGDGTNDVKITYHKQFKKGASATADVTFQSVTTSVAAPPKVDKPATDTTTEPIPTTPNKTGTMLVTIIVVIVIIVVGYFLIKGKKK